MADKEICIDSIGSQEEYDKMMLDIIKDIQSGTTLVNVMVPAGNYKTARNGITKWLRINLFTKYIGLIKIIEEIVAEGEESLLETMLRDNAKGKG